MTRRQKSKQWSGGIAAHRAPPQKIPSKKSAGKVLTSIFLDQDGILLIDYLPKCQTINAEHFSFLLAGAIGGHFEGKAPQEVHQGGLVLARQCPGSPGSCNPEETGLLWLPMTRSPTLFSGSGPVGLPPVLWTEKTIERSPFFFRRSHCCRGDLVGRTTF